MSKADFDLFQVKFYALLMQYGDVKVRDGIIQVRIGPLEYIDMTVPKYHNKER